MDANMIQIQRLGRLNIQLAKKADAVVEVVYSIPVFHKGKNILEEESICQ